MWLNDEGNKRRRRGEGAKGRKIEEGKEIEREREAQ